MADQPTKNSEFFDFDAWYAEHVAATIPFRLLGQEWQIPGDCEAAVLLRLQRLEQAILTGHIPDGLEAELAGMSYDGMCRELVGNHIFEQWLAKGIKGLMLQAVTRRLYAIYKGDDPDAAMGLGKPVAPQPKAPTDHKTKAKKAAGSTSSGGASNTGS